MTPVCTIAICLVIPVGIPSETRSPANQIVPVVPIFAPRTAAIAAGSGSAFAWDNSAVRWGLSGADETAKNATTYTPRQYVVSVSGSATSPSGNPSDFGASTATRAGMMHVNTSNGEIWIYS